MHTTTSEVGQENLQQIRNFVECLRVIQADNVGGEYWSWFLRKATGMVGRAHHTEHQVAREWYANNRPRARMCFHNSQLWMINNKKVTYAEGWMFNGTIPISHGWPVFDGRIYDLTLDSCDTLLKRERIPLYELSRCAYLGIQIPRKLVAAYYRDEPDGQATVLPWLFQKFPESVEDASSDQVVL